MKKFSIFLTLLITSFNLVAQTPSENASVQVHATVSSSPASITVKWASNPGSSSMVIYRKLSGAANWGSIYASLGGSATQYIDNNVSIGQLYEYKMVRSGSNGNGYGYLSSGVEVPAIEQRGKMILMIDDTHLPALESAVQVLIKDLRGDGWGIIRHNVSPSATVPSIKSLIVSDYNSDPSGVKAVFLLGHIPVPYTGNVIPDGHTENQGAWPADVYYGDVDGVWTDLYFHTNTAQRAANNNVAGDGKFDQSDLPSDVELQVGRVDMYDMPAFSQSETQMLADYLAKAHNYKQSLIDPIVRGIVFDNLQWIPDPLASSGWRNLAQFVGPSNITAPYPYGPEYNTYVNNQSYLWTYASGGGLQLTTDGELTYNGSLNIGTTQEYANMNMDGIFNMSFGSYYGDWDNKNNFLRALIASGNSLTNCWAAIPNYFFHHMAMGQNIGYSIRATQNNTTTYTPHNSGWQSSIGRTHVAMMGDPSLRVHMIDPPSNFIVSDGGGFPSFSWTASPESGVVGYYIYEVDTIAGTITRITPNVVNGTVFQDPSISIATVKYMVRAVKLQTTRSGSYYDMSTGVISELIGGTPAIDCNGVPNGPDMPGTPCDDGDANTGDDQWSGNCICVGLPIDCAGVPGGTAVLDGCGVCDGDNSTCAGCDGVPNSGLVLDQCGVCDGDNSTCTDCMGVINGTAVMDPCGVCNGDGTSCSQVSICFDLATDADSDVEETQNGNVYGNEALLDLAYDPTDGGWRGDQHIGLRFADINIQQGTTITEAYVQFTSGDNVNINPSSLLVFAEDVDDAPQIGWAQFELSSRTRTTAQVAWNPAPWNNIGAAGIDQQTPDLVDVIQEVVDRAGWAANNDILVLISGTGTRCARTSNDNPNDAAQLCITYSTAAVADCEGVVGGSALPGTACNDGDASTGDDTWNNSCACVGQLIDCEGVPGGSSLPGSACDDGDPNTGNDVYNNNCNCAGQLLDCQGTPGGAALPGTTCDDGDASTGNDTWNNSCNCVGQMFDCEGVAGGSSLPGSTCDDGDSNTGNDVYNGNCNCEGQLIDCMGIAGGGSLPGTPCDDGDPNTSNDVWDLSCNCGGGFVDCMGVSGGSALPGTPCDDGDPNTGDDTWNGNCSCEGQVIDCEGVAGGNALPGASCDDGDPSTGNDVYNNSCNCSGQLIDCLGVAGGSSLPGTACDDGDASTGNDTYDNDCNCNGALVDCAGVAGGSAAMDNCGICAGGTTGLIPDPDVDNDGVLDCNDNCMDMSNIDQEDADNDEVGDVCDNCLLVYNPDQLDLNNNGIGDVCEIATGIEENVQEIFSIWPNPSRGELNIKFNGEAELIMVHNLLGEQVLVETFTQRLNIEPLQRGVYMISVADKNGIPIRTERLIKN